MKRPSTLDHISMVELFAGIGGFRIAAENLGVKTTWANDIDQYASLVYKNRFKTDAFVEGDIWRLLDRIPNHNLLTGGFPCQPFSSAGKKKGIEDPRGTLFEAIVKILKQHQPDYFILENVKRLLVMDQGFHFATILASLASLDYRIEWRLLNAMDFSLPQNRQRVVITGIHRRKLKQDGINPYDVDAIRLASAEELNLLSSYDKENLVEYQNWIDVENHGAAFPNWGIAYDGRFFSAQLRDFVNKKPLKLLKGILQKKVDDAFDLTEVTNQWISKNTPVNKFVGGVEILSNQAGGARMGYTIFGTNGVAPTLTSSTSRHYERYKVGEKYRRLTPAEYALIQGFPYNHCDIAPLRERYVLYGNAVPPPLVQWVMERILLPVEPKGIEVEYKLPFHKYAAR